jgi:hypothetical protein
LTKACAICRLDLKGQEEAVYSPTTKSYYCRVTDWDACAKRAENLYQAEKKGWV